MDETTFGPDVRSTVSGTERERAATDAVEAVVSQAKTHGGVSTVSHVEHGSPVEAILERIESNDIHAVGMGARGRRGTDRILLGSVAEKTVCSAPVTVTTVTDLA